MQSEMWATIFEKYASKKVANKILVLTTLINLKGYKTSNMRDYVSAMESSVNRLASMGMRMSEPMQIAILLMSLSDLPGYSSTVSSLKTMYTNEAKCDDVMKRFIEERKQAGNSAIGLTNGNSKGVLGSWRTTTKKKNKDFVCWACNMRGNWTRDCFSAGNKDEKE